MGSSTLLALPAMLGQRGRHCKVLVPTEARHGGRGTTSHPGSFPNHFALSKRTPPSHPVVTLAPAPQRSDLCPALLPGSGTIRKHTAILLLPRTKTDKIGNTTEIPSSFPRAKLHSHSLQYSGLEVLRKQLALHT